MSKLGIKIYKDQVDIQLEEHLHEQDVLQMLKFDTDNAEQLLCTHASTQAYWGALAIRLKTRLEKFKEIWVKKWYAHNRSYAKHVLEAYSKPKTQPTVGAIADKCILIYSMDTTENERNRYAEAAFISMSKSKGIKEFNGSQVEFTANMYKYLKSSPPWYFETVQETLKTFEEEFEIVRNVADRFHSQGFHLDLFAKLQMDRQFKDSISEKDLMKRVKTGG